MLTKIGGRGCFVSTMHEQSPASQIVHLIISIGNSHMIGRVVAQGETFPTKVWEYGVAETLVQPPFAMLDHNGDGQNDLSPMLTFSEDYLAANSSIDRLVFIPNAQGSTGFSNNVWAADQVPNNLSEVVTRHNDAKAALEALGYTVVTRSVHYHASRPDFDSNTPEQLTDDIEAMITYLRANLDGVDATLPVIIGGGMTASQLAGRSADDVNFQSAFNGVKNRIPYTWNMDMINPQDGYETGLPVMPYDGVHADHAGELAKGHLHYNALLNALSNDKPNDPFESLSMWNDFVAFHDFRSGGGLDYSGNGNHLTLADAANPPLMVHDTATGGVDAIVSTNTNGAANRYWHMGVPLPDSYTKVIMVRFTDLDGTEGIFQNHDQGVRFFYTNGANEIRAYHDNSGVAVSISGNDINLGEWHTIAVTYDQATTTMSIYLDGVLKETNSGVAAHSGTVMEVVGAQNLVGQRPFRGDFVYAGYTASAMSQTQITELHDASQTLLTPPAPPPAVITDLSEISGIQRHHDVKVSSSITHVAGKASQIDDLSGNGYHLSQAVAQRQPTYDATTDSLLFERSQSNRLIGDGAFMYNSPNGGTIIAVVDYLSLMNADTLASEYSSTTSAYYSIARLRGDTTPTPQSGDDAGSSVINDNRLTSIDVVAIGKHVYAQHIESELMSCDINDVAGDVPQTLDRTGHTLTLDKFTLGSRRGNDRFPHVRVYELAAWDRKLTETEYAQAYNMLALKWGINP
ncbi:MAG: LamG-like jellyroll fold domain-containing protein [Alphaproteobacteria bacterium]